MTGARDRARRRDGIGAVPDPERSLPVRVLIVLAHPEPQSFNGALTRAGRRALEATGHEVEVTDLYRQGFGAIAGPGDLDAERVPAASRRPFDLAAAQAEAIGRDGFVAEITAEQAKLARADALVLQFPMWWFGPPAVLKGWADRVLVKGFAYGGGRKYATGVFRGRRAMVAVTTGAGAAAFTPEGGDGEMSAVLWPVHTILRYCGFDVAEPFVVFAPGMLSEHARGQALEDYGRRLVGLAEAAPSTPAEESRRAS